MRLETYFLFHFKQNLRNKTPKMGNKIRTQQPDSPEKNKP